MMNHSTFHSVTSVICSRLGVNPKRLFWNVAGTGILATSLWAGAAFAGDPFRSGSQAHSIGPKTEAAFRSLFEQGNYPQAELYVQEALQSEPNEPLSYAMRAFFAYQQKDQAALNRYATQTREVAERLAKTDPLRSQIYIGVGHVLEVGAVVASDQASSSAGSPQVFAQVQQVFKAIDAAAAIAPNDPELNLVKGFIDLLLAANFPLSSPDRAVERLEDYAAPDYVVYRGLAVFYRDQKQPTKALAAIERALRSAPGNPELLYIKGRILSAQGKRQESLALFEQALAKKNQLPESLVKQITQERDQILRPTS